MFFQLKVLKDKFLSSFLVASRLHRLSIKPHWMALKGCDVTIVYQGIIPLKDDNKYNHGVGQFSSHRQSVAGSILGTVDVKQMFFDQGFTHPNCSSSIKPFTISHQTQVLHVGNSCLHFAPKTIQPWIYMQ